MTPSRMLDYTASAAAELHHAELSFGRPLDAQERNLWLKQWASVEGFECYVTHVRNGG